MRPRRLFIILAILWPGFILSYYLQFFHRIFGNLLNEHLSAWFFLFPHWSLAFFYLLELVFIVLAFYYPKEKQRKGA